MYHLLSQCSQQSDIEDNSKKAFQLLFSASLLHTCLSLCSSTRYLLHFFFLFFCFKMIIFFTGHLSELKAGHSNTCALSHAFAMCSECRPALYFRKMNGCPWKRCLQSKLFCYLKVLFCKNLANTNINHLYQGRYCKPRAWMWDLLLMTVG